MTSGLSSPNLHPGQRTNLPDERIITTTGNKFLGVGSSNGLLATVSDGPVAMAMLDPIASEVGPRGDVVVRKKLSKLLKGKEEEWTAVAQKKGPLQLLDLPIDVLKEIVKEVTHTNDLTALALTHSALHGLAIPHIYSRFDIVWPDTTSAADTRIGVDALTYGLATLVMGHDVFGSCTVPNAYPNSCGRPSICSNCGARSFSGVGLPRQQMLGNNYPQYTRKFSLGNGPPDWVQEYMITKESGKMLGTLVALAVSRMINLEAFIWDMPTGVLRDVWLALSSLQFKVPPDECRLERVLVRWHDNSFDQPSSPQNSNGNPNPAPYNPAGSTLTPIGILVPPPPATISTDQSTTLTDHNASQIRVEYPTFSVLPPLKSLSVLDIDELAYLDEMSVLIEKSKDRLLELRVGISRKAHNRDFVLAWDGPGLQQVDHDAKWPGAPSKIGERRLGGVLGTLVGRVYDIRKKPKITVRSKASNVTPVPTTQLPTVQTQQDAHIPGESSVTLPAVDNLTAVINSEGGPNLIASQEPLPVLSFPENGNMPLFDFSASEELSVSAAMTSPSTGLPLTHKSPHSTVLNRSTGKDQKQLLAVEELSADRKRLDGMLKLRVLELERVPLSIALLQKAFDWSVMTSLTILDCAYHESLWRMLRRQFQPQICPKSALATSTFVRNSIATNSASKQIPSIPMEYQLNLKKIHTDVATPALISFLRETLAPNTLEVLFLQDRRKNTASTVSINDIYRGPLRRHRRSLKKLLIDSSDKIPRGPNASNDSARWRTWMLNHEVLSYITSGNMTSLRELSIAIEYKDWHFFLRRLPQIPTLRSLNIPFIADHVTPSYDPRELAMQVVDMIFLRPEIELLYLGISNKCFEIIENRQSEESNTTLEPPGSGSPGGNATDDEEDDDDGDGSDDDADGDEEDEEDDGIATEAVEADGMDYEPSDTGESELESMDGSDDGRSKFSLRLREILFYDDKVAIFKARHMRL